MIIKIGSENNVKINAVKEVLTDYPIFKDSIILGVKSSSEVSNQPKSLEETIKGAMNRAKNCFIGCDYSFGLESGLIKVPFTKTGYMDVTACCIFDGKNNNIGLSSAFEYPIKVTNLVFSENIEINESFFKNNLTKDKKIGSSEGAIGFLTKGRIKRIDYTKQAIQMALIHLENPLLY